MYKQEIKISDKNLIIETGIMAKQANGAVTVTYGETIVLVTATSNMSRSTDLGYFPLSVDYRAKMYAAGKIPGGFFKREGRPSEDEIIASRLTDRPIRPLFPKGFMCEVQILINVLSYDGEHDPDILGSIGASAALSISDIPWNGPVGSVRVGYIDEKYIINPTIEQSESSEMEIIISGTKDSIVMVEGEANFISEETFLSGIQYGHEAIKDIIEIQESLVKECGKTKFEFSPAEIDTELRDKVLKTIDGKIAPFNEPKMKEERYKDIQDYTDSIVDSFEDEYPEDGRTIRNIIDEEISDDLRKRTIKGTRADGRGHSEIRDITIENGALEICKKSHKGGLLKQTWNEPKNRTVQIIVDEEVVNKYEQIKLPIKAGDFLFFDQYLMHRSGYNSTKDEIRFSLVIMWNDCSHSDWSAPIPNFRYRTISPKENFDKLMSNK